MLHRIFVESVTALHVFLSWRVGLLVYPRSSNGYMVFFRSHTDTGLFPRIPFPRYLHFPFRRQVVFCSVPPHMPSPTVNLAWPASPPPPRSQTSTRATYPTLTPN